MDSDDEAIQQFEDCYKECVALHKRSYPSSHPDFDEMNLSGRLRQGLNPSVQGHFADVYKGRLDGQLVAIKLLRYSDTTYRTVVLRFVREVSTWSVLDHVNISSLLGIIVGGGRIGLVSHWHENGTLAQFLTRTDDPPTLDLILDVAEGTQYLHTCPTAVIHGDLKGANILISEIGIARLTDFGISKQPRDPNRRTYLTTSGGTKGTTPWMAPELEDIDASISFASDIYSCAGVFLEICCPGKYPYHYFSQIYDILHTKKCGELPNRSQYPEMARRNALWQLMSVCWAADPSKRPEIGEIVLTLYAQFRLLPRLSEDGVLRDSSLCRRCDPTFSTMDGQLNSRAPFACLTHAIHTQGRSANGHPLFTEAPGPSIWTRHSPPPGMEQSNSVQTPYNMVRHVRGNRRGEGHRPAARGDRELSMALAEVGTTLSHCVPTADIDTLTLPKDDPQNSGTQFDPPNTPGTLNSTASGRHTELWEAYNRAQDLEDKEFIKATGSDLDALLIFAGLFSAVNTAFIADSYKRLELQLIDEGRNELLRILSNASIESSQAMIVTTPFTASLRVTRMNASFFVSLGCSLCAAFGAVLAKRWLSWYKRDVGGTSFERVIVNLPTVLQCSLVFFFFGLVDLLLSLGGELETIVSIIPYFSFNTFLYYSTTIIVFIASEGMSRARAYFL